MLEAERHNKSFQRTALPPLNSNVGHHKSSMCIDSFSSVLTSFTTASWEFLNSNLAIAIIGGFAGAIGGALGGQQIVERSRWREEKLKELRHTNAAIMVAHTICNAALAVKKQHVLPMQQSFLKSKSELEEFKIKRNSGKTPKDAEFHMQMDMRTYPAPIVPMDTLKHVVFQELSVVGRPLALVAVIEQSLIGLTAAIAKRDQLIMRFATGEIHETVHANYYFGLPLQGGHVNQEFPDLVEGIYSYVDDLAFFSYQLCVDLMKHGTKIREALVKKSSKKVPNVNEADFSGPLKSGLMPPDSQYSDWLNAFVERPVK